MDNNANLEEMMVESLSQELEHNLIRIKETFGESNDIVVRTFTFGQGGQFNGALIYVEGITDKFLINESLVKPLMYGSRFMDTGNEEEAETVTIGTIKSSMLSLGSVEEISTLDEVVERCLSGDTVLLVDGFNEALVLNTTGIRALHEGIYPGNPCDGGHSLW